MSASVGVGVCSINLWQSGCVDVDMGKETSRLTMIELPLRQ